MREIKFRAWKSWRKPTMLYSGQFDIEYSHPKKRYQAIDHSRFEGQWDMPLMQFTGLRDKNGKEIYEGDIISGWLAYKGKREKLPIASIEYFEPEARFEAYSNDVNSEIIKDLSGKDMYSEGWSIAVKQDLVVNDMDRFAITGECEVIGNIYENPELLKQT